MADEQKKSPETTSGWVTGVIGVIAVIAVIGLLYTMAGGESTPEYTLEDLHEAAVAATPDMGPPDLEVLSTEWEHGEYGNRFATGKVRNNSTHTYTYAQVQINLYDAEGNLVGSTLANINNLEPKDTWEFRAVILPESATRFRVMDVNGW